MPTRRALPAVVLPTVDSAIRPALVRWFDRHQRALPWRQTRDPYAIWVSEIMLQQTQVDRVIGYWSAFIKRYPTVQKLAKARLEEVLTLWQGLGYYSRARNLHRAAQQIVADHGGLLPKSVDGLRALPGFGRYTAGAVASIAYGLKAPLVDGNVARVFSRLFAIDLPVGVPARETLLWQYAEALVKGPRPGDFNQALMELGATVCVPQNPMCLLCPVQAHCEARKQGRVDQLPPPKRATARHALTFSVAVCRREKTLLLARRPETGLFSGLWELPCVPTPTGGDPTEAFRALLGASAEIGPRFATIERTLTHRDLTFHLHDVTLATREPRQAPATYVDVRWCDLAQRDALAISSAMQAVIAAASGAARRPRQAAMNRQRRRTGAR